MTGIASVLLFFIAAVSTSTAAVAVLSLRAAVRICRFRLHQRKKQADIQMDRDR
ncbi:hypothetical protein CE91St60_13020 [[Clostridium] scindens]|nr:hypothetical protein CE91St60_13020 [[Clostridium] scindens]